VDVELRRCEQCEEALCDSRLASRKSGDGYSIEFLACGHCGHENLTAGWVDARPADFFSGYLKYNERTALFDEFNNDGILIRANVILSPIVNVPSPYTGWPHTKPKPKRASSETWLFERASPRSGDRPFG
jgi:hypothetical protein